jgi:biotin carboxyl carrier protein
VVRACLNPDGSIPRILTALTKRIFCQWNSIVCGLHRMVVGNGGCRIAGNTRGFAHDIDLRPVGLVRGLILENDAGRRAHESRNSHFDLKCRAAIQIRGRARRSPSRFKPWATSYAKQQLSRTEYLARSETASRQALDQAENDVASTRRRRTSQPRRRSRQAPTEEERAIADAQVKAAASALAVLERRLDKTVLWAPADGIVSVIVAEVGENIHAGQPVLEIAATGKQWLPFNAREDLLHGLTIGVEDRDRTGGCAQTNAGTHHRGWCRSGRSRPGRRSGRSAITTAARYACASTRRATQLGSNPG